MQSVISVDQFYVIKMLVTPGVTCHREQNQDQPVTLAHACAVIGLLTSSDAFLWQFWSQRRGDPGDATGGSCTSVGAFEQGLSSDTAPLGMCAGGEPW